MDTYFSRCHNQPYAFFHESIFRYRLDTGQLPDFLVFALLATALRFYTGPYYGEQQQEALKQYANASWRFIAAHWVAAEEVPTIEVVQAITFISIIDFTGSSRLPNAKLNVTNT